MGEVYLAEDSEAGRKVAIKVLPRKYSDDPDFIARFRREAEAASKLRHDNIVGAYETGLELGYCFYVMEYCDGEPLDKKLRREGKLAWIQATKLMMQAARGLHYAHSHGIIHRDIKPANIMVTREGVAKILDLGLSKNVTEKGGSFTTVTGAVMGTPHYIAPEQANAEPTDARADIYSLGATLYHLVTGTTPFTGTTPVEILYKQVHAQLPNPQDANEDLPDTLVHVIRKMMAKDPRDRYPDCDACLLDLEEVVAGRSPSTNILEPAKSAVALLRVRPPRKRTTVRRSSAEPATRTAGLVAVAIVAAIAVAFSVLVFQRNSGGEEKSAGRGQSAGPTAGRGPAAACGPSAAVGSRAHRGARSVAERHRPHAPHRSLEGRRRRNVVQEGRRASRRSLPPRATRDPLRPEPAVRFPHRLHAPGRERRHEPAPDADGPAVRVADGRGRQHRVRVRSGSVPAPRDQPQRQATVPLPRDGPEV
jgi:hypothetical protein